MTSRHLYLLRHAKSSWEDPRLPDHDRPLAPRGRRAARRLGDHLRGTAAGEPALVLCSSAARARETLELLDLRAPVSVEPELYGASSQRLLERLRRVPAALPSLLLVGHNPGIEELALLVAAEGPLRTAVATKFPTGALATLAFEGGWDGLRRGGGEIAAFVRPRDLG